MTLTRDPGAKASDESLEIVETEASVTIGVRVVPRASRSEIVGLHGRALKIRIASPPVDGAANEELVRMLAKTLRVPRSAVAVASGEASRSKRVRIDLSAREFAQRLGLPSIVPF